MSTVGMVLHTSIDLGHLAKVDGSRSVQGMSSMIAIHTSPILCIVASNACLVVK
jgi:hypothetical protein